MAEKSLLSRVKELEAYRERCEKAKEEKWQKSINKKLEAIEAHFIQQDTQQDTEKKKEWRTSVGRSVIASALPVFGIGVASTVHAILKGYDWSVFLSSQEFYMFAIGLFLVIMGRLVLVGRLKL